MRSGRKFSTKPMSAMPGRWTSLTVMSARDASDSDRSSSCNSSRWSSNNRATPIDLTVDSVLVIRGSVLRARRLGVVRAVQAPFPARGVDALLLAPAHALLEPLGGQLDGGARIEVRLGDDHVLLVRAQRDLGRVELALLRHDHPHLVDARIVLAQLLQPLLRERAHVGTEFAVAGSHVDLHGTLPRAVRGPTMFGSSGRRGVEGQLLGHAPAEPGGQDLHLFTVLRHGPARDLQA